MKIAMILSVLLAGAGAARAQTIFAPSGSVGTSSTSGVGIGTSNPSSKFQVDTGALSWGVQPYTIDLSYSGGGGWARDYRIFHSVGTTNRSYFGATGGPGVVSRAYWTIGDAGAAIVGLNLTTGINLLANGNVGIGTLNPGDRFHVQISGSESGISLDDGGLNYNPFFTISRAGAPRLSLSATSLVGTVSGRGGNGLALSGNGTAQDVLIAPSGNVGIGTTGSIYRVAINSGSNSYCFRARTVGDFVFALAGDGLKGADIDLFSIRNNNTNVVHLNTVNGARMALGVSNSTNAGTISEDLTITSGGNVGIGTTTPTQKLSVNGTIRAKEVIVETAGWSDYVFADNYTLAPLSEVEQQIKANKHLPGIPSANDVAAQGIGVGEMQAKLLGKIEELTLHVIRQQKEIEALQRENAEFRHGRRNSESP